jgi:hypothetical protein
LFSIKDQDVLNAWAFCAFQAMPKLPQIGIKDWGDYRNTGGHDLPLETLD